MCGLPIIRQVQDGADTTSAFAEAFGVHLFGVILISIVVEVQGVRVVITVTAFRVFSHRPVVTLVLAFDYTAIEITGGRQENTFGRIRFAGDLIAAKGATSDILATVITAFPSPCAVVFVG